MTAIVLFLWAFIWNLVGAALGIIPIGLIFLVSKGCARIWDFLKGKKRATSNV